jgi:hypothetical protein
MNFRRKDAKSAKEEKTKGNKIIGAKRRIVFL